MDKHGVTFFILEWYALAAVHELRVNKLLMSLVAYPHLTELSSTCA